MFMKWKGALSELLVFGAALNRTYPAITFTLEVSTREVVFLDLKIHVSDDSISSTNYVKPLNIFQYIPRIVQCSACGTG